jgi:hypothetical protein
MLSFCFSYTYIHHLRCLHCASFLFSYQFGISGNGPDRSMADFTWCMTAIDWGWPIEETAAKPPEISEEARERVQVRDEGYPLIAAQNAAAAVERNELKRGRS